MQKNVSKAAEEPFFGQQCVAPCCIVHVACAEVDSTEHCLQNEHPTPPVHTASVPIYQRSRTLCLPALIHGPQTGYNNAGPANTAVLDNATDMPNEPSTCTIRLQTSIKISVCGCVSAVCSQGCHEYSGGYSVCNLLPALTLKVPSVDNSLLDRLMG